MRKELISRHDRHRLGQEPLLHLLGQLQVSVHPVALEPGDVALIYSDGVTDSRSPREELYDTRDNRRLVKRMAESSGGPEAVGRAILQDIREFSAGHAQADDITLICFGPKAD